MANFNTHLAFAGAGASVAAGGVLSVGAVDAHQAGWLVLLGTLAGVLPDVDSDHSRSLRLVFGLLTVVGIALMQVLLPAHASWGVRALSALGVLIGMRHLLYPAFARLTVHRGLFHSVPAALLAGLLADACLWLGAGWSAPASRLAGMFVAGGYLLHLLLDECYSVNLAGHRLKASFGSALTLFSLREWPGYVLLYLAVLGAYWLLPHRLTLWV